MVSDMETCANQKTGEGVILREGDSVIVKKKKPEKGKYCGWKGQVVREGRGDSRVRE